MIPDLPRSSGKSEGPGARLTDHPLYHRMFGNDPFGSRPKPGAYLIAPILLLPPSEVPEGRARGLQDTAARVQSECER
jgi:hypothetical protein